VKSFARTSSGGVNCGRVEEHCLTERCRSFIEVEELIFGERSSVLINPAEEKLQNEFAGVKRTFIPLYAVVRIDEVEREGVSKVRPVEGGDNVTPFPQPPFPPSGGRGKD